MFVYEVTYNDGSRDVIEADSAELVADEWHFVRTVGGSGEERVWAIAASRVVTVEPRAV